MVIAIRYMTAILTNLSLIRLCIPTHYYNYIDKLLWYLVQFNLDRSDG